MNEEEPDGHQRVVWWGQPALYGFIAAVALVLQGQLGRITTWMDGDMQYHRGVALSISRIRPIGEGPYDGLPSYVTGIYHYALASIARLGLWPDTVVSIVSWVEPIAWIAAAYFLASRLWSRISVRLVFVTLLVFGAGVASSADRIWVDAVALSGHAYWPLYPRDLALILLMVAIAVALHSRPVLAGIVAGVAIGVHPQIGAVAALWAATTMVIGRDRLRWRRGAVVLAAAGLVSIWYWLPRIVLVLDLGGFQVVDFRNPLRLTLMNIWLGLGLLLPFAAAGAVLGLRDRRRPSIMASAWIIALIAPVLVASLVGSELLTTRRTLLLLALPLLVLAAEFAAWLSCRLPNGWGRAALAVLLISVLVLSVPSHRATRTLLGRIWQDDRYAAVDYPTETWTPVLEEADTRSRGGTVLIAERDAPVLWYLTGTSVPWMKRPGFVKTGFDVGAATGWSEDDREAEVARAFVTGRSAICSLMRDREIETVVLRSERDLIGTFDWIPAADQRRNPTESYSDANKYDALHVPARTLVGFAPPPDIELLDVWYLPHRPEPRVILDTGTTIINPVRTVSDGRARKSTFEVSGIEPQLRFGFDTDTTLLRVVGYTPFEGVDAPATALGRLALCGSGSS